MIEDQERKARLEVSMKLGRAILYVDNGELATARELAGEAAEMIDKILEGES